MQSERATVRPTWCCVIAVCLAVGVGWQPPTAPSPWQMVRRAEGQLLRYEYYELVRAFRKKAKVGRWREKEATKKVLVSSPYPLARVIFCTCVTSNLPVPSPRPQRLVR